jgi:hypothetical protein
LARMPAEDQAKHTSEVEGEKEGQANGKPCVSHDDGDKGFCVAISRSRGRFKIA